jgi:poly-gamma-glutamate synthesis protein (capsule biosynthesis protein)
VPLPEGQPWAVSLIDENKIVADARNARLAGADVVVVSLHWGTEWQDAPDDRQLTLARTLTASRTGGRPDIDLILGGHAHVPQAYEKVNGTWVVYGMGDQLAGKMNDPRGSMSSAARFTFVPPKAGKASRPTAGAGARDAKGRSDKARSDKGRSDKGRSDKGRSDKARSDKGRSDKGQKSGKSATSPGRQGEWSVKKAEFIPFFVQTTPRISVVDLSQENARDAGTGRAEAFRTIREAVLSRGAAKQGLRMGH